MAKVQGRLQTKTILFKVLPIGIIKDISYVMTEVLTERKIDLHIVINLLRFPILTTFCNNFV